MPFDSEKFIARASMKLRQDVGSKKALMALSGGVDSSTAAALAHKALGKQLHALFLDTGFMREGEPEQVKKMMKDAGIDVRIADVGPEFFSSVRGIKDAEEKRKAFRSTFYSIFSRESKKLGCDLLIQGTIAPDWIETMGGIKSQHNILEQIGIKPKEAYGYSVLEPLKDLYKDQVRLVGKALGLPEFVFARQPFPGPGLLVRCVGEVREDKVRELRRAVAIVEANISNNDAQQYFAAIFDSEPNTKSEKMAKEASALLDGDEVSATIYGAMGTGVKGDLRFYGKLAGIKTTKQHPLTTLGKIQLDLIIKNKDVARILLELESRPTGKYCVAIRAINTRDFMTATISQIDYARLHKMAKEILAKCPSACAVYYDVTSKPPATIEFE